MELTGEIKDLSKDYKTDKPILQLVLNERDCFISLEELKNIKLAIQVKKWTKKRSKNANNYFWELLSEYSEEKNVDAIEEYKERVKRLGIFRRFRIENKDIKTFEKMWTDRGIAWFCETADTEYMGEIEFKIINAYYGSSSFNSKQMSRLINDLVEDCKEVGIETKTPAEIKSLLESWK